MAAPTHRQYSLNCRTCCICDRPCAILECQCLENFQHNTSEHGNLMKRLAAAFSMPVSAKDLHSFSLCCSCEHHLVVIEQANRIKECIKRVFLETREHRNFLNSHPSNISRIPPSVAARTKRLSSMYADSRSFDEASPRVKRSRICAGSTSLPVPSTLGSITGTTLSVPAPATSHHLSFDDCSSTSNGLISPGSRLKGSRSSVAPNFTEPAPMIDQVFYETSSSDLAPSYKLNTARTSKQFVTTYDQIDGTMDTDLNLSSGTNMAESH